jgi:hypothetical protein
VNKQTIDKIFGSFIRLGEPTVAPKTFFQILEEIEQERGRRTIELKAKVVRGKLQFEPSSELTVKDNEILVGTQRIVVRVS